MTRTGGNERSYKLHGKCIVLIIIILVPVTFLAVKVKIELTQIHELVNTQGYRIDKLEGK